MEDNQESNMWLKLIKQTNPKKRTVNKQQTHIYVLQRSILLKSVLVRREIRKKENSWMKNVCILQNAEILVSVDIRFGTGYFLLWWEAKVPIPLTL